MPTPEEYDERIIENGVYRVAFDKGWQSVLKIEFNSWNDEGRRRFVGRVKDPSNQQQRAFYDIYCRAPARFVDQT